ncbi:Fic family protein [Paenibacillus sp. WST5]|uniref:Fic family protein n=2 Tax=Paenibacillus sedimenti TaxID=2770274 RepID=A0A926KUS0_9BACL|nr:Fic family protein [Paenibacillus sedimenti]
MWEQIERLKAAVDSKRPLQPDLLKIIIQKFREEWTYHSNAIEGNTFTYQETAFFLREGLTVKGKTLREHLEIVNHAEAIDYLTNILEERDLTERLIKDFHAILFQGVKDINFALGEYKKTDNHVLTVSGEIHPYCSYILVPQEMQSLLDWYIASKLTVHPVKVAAILHHRVASIHPFPDGNGRVSRLCMNFILMKNGYPPAVIRNENRFEYYQALEAADNNDLDPFVQLVANEVKQSLELMAKSLN